MRKRCHRPLGARAACSAPAMPGGNAEDAARPRQRDFQVGAFDRVALAGSHDVVVTVGGAPSVRAEGDAEALERLDIRVENGELRIGIASAAAGSRSATIAASPSTSPCPALDGASIGGSGDIRIDRVAGRSASRPRSPARATSRSARCASARPILDRRLGRHPRRRQCRARERLGRRLGRCRPRRASRPARRRRVAGSGDIARPRDRDRAIELLGSGDVNVAGAAPAARSRRWARATSAAAADRLSLPRLIDGSSFGVMVRHDRIVARPASPSPPRRARRRRPTAAIR